MAAKKSKTPWGWYIGGGVVAALGAGGYYLYRRLSESVAEDGPGVVAVMETEPPPSPNEPSSVGLAHLHLRCGLKGHKCRETADCCPPPIPRTPDGRPIEGARYTVSCIQDPKIGAGDPDKRTCYHRLSTQATAAWDAPANLRLPNQTYGAGGHIRVKIPIIRYITSFTNKKDETVIMDLSEGDFERFLSAIEKAGGSETLIPRCRTRPPLELLLVPASKNMLPQNILSKIFQAANSNDKSYLARYAVKKVTITPGPVEAAMFKDLWPGNYILYTKYHTGSRTTTIGVENFEQGVQNHAQNVYAFMSTYLSGGLDFSTVTVRHGCQIKPGYVFVSTKGEDFRGAAGTHAGKTRHYTLQYYFQWHFFEGDQSDANEALQNVMNKVGKFVGDKISSMFD